MNFSDILKGLPWADRPMAAPEKIQLTEIIIVIANQQAAWLAKAVESIRALHPVERLSGPRKAIAQAVVASLVEQSAAATATARDYRARLAQLLADHPECQAGRPQGGDLHAFDDMFTWPLWQMQQWLPGAISNAPHLDAEQRAMAKSVAACAGAGQDRLANGITAIGQLLAAATTIEPASTQAIGSLLAWLNEEARFLQHCSVEYSVAACNVPGPA